ncbi:hypothetical protein CBR_g21802 [Chara braunii]|uniref:beta-galactosidase n=1 Tax=Chara braunii TaxID=69332 RepID=A0A388JUL7_CHABU|nr:hypothetical protein CBR_g21802 [Chara braunii]|eukprot:GBG61457.1 hypothetical protein CBR_g21802 [Chara braunii]
MEHRQKAICLFLGISLFFAGGVLHLCRQHPSKFINEKRTHVGAVRRFRLGEDTFFLDGKPLQIVSGSIHYFRIHPEYWRDRLMRVKALGLNTIQFYVPWNFHEQKRGNVRFDGWQDFPKFCRIAQEVGLLVMLRLGPYVCGEWEFGGFPEWLLTENVELRSSDPAYLRLVDEWWDHLLPEVVPLLYKNGGPIIMVQVENEFGAYRPSKNESQYLKHLVNRAKAALGNDVVIYTTDQPPSITFGSLPGGSVYSAVDFGMYQDSAAAFKIQKDFNAPGPSPPMNTEYYTGWFTCWKDPISITDFSILAKGLIGVFKMNASVSFYMAHGGTNFGYWSGAYGSETKFATDITSYDYDAPIREDGDLRQPKFDGGFQPVLVDI